MFHGILAGLHVNIEQDLEAGGLARAHARGGERSRVDRLMFSPTSLLLLF